MTDSTPQTFLDAHGLTRRRPQPIPDTPSSVAALVDSIAERHGDAIALADRRARYRYVELREAVDRAADVMRRAGLKPYDRVAFSLPNTVDVVVSFLATMRLGAIWVGVNTHLALPEKRFLIENCDASLLVTTREIAESLRSELPALATIIVDIESPGAWWADGDTSRSPVTEIDPFGPAAIAYTSGTTGRPKGVVQSQHNMLLPAASITRSEPQPLVQGVCLPFTILNMQVLSTVQTLLSGGTCVPMDRIDVVGLAGWIAEFGIQRMYATPPTVYDLLTRSEIDPGDIATLSHLGVGGSKCPEGLRERYRERFKTDFNFGYGLTEAPTGVTGGLEKGVLPIGCSGPARSHVCVTIRDVEGAVLGVDAEGEVCIGAAEDGIFAGCYSTMLGYWDRPDATEQALRGGVLHTGDVGRLDADGYLWILDRRSDLIIRGGANVYPAEVERVVESLASVAEVAVVPRDHPRLGEEVIAFVRPSDVDGRPAELVGAALVDACQAALARYKVPVEWYVVEQFPRNAMGKVVKPALRAWLEGGESIEGVAQPVLLEA